jgi:transcriptional regulator with XRE-family HTH domain
MSLRETRQQRGLTQAQLAEIAGVDQTTVSDIELGKNLNPSWETVKRISNALGVAPEELFPLREKGEAA